MIRSHVLICGGTGCTSSGSKVLISTFESEIEKNGLADEVKVVQTACFGLCALGPVVIIYPEGTFYSRVQADDVAEIVSEHLLKGRLVDRLVYKDADENVIEEAGKQFHLATQTSIRLRRELHCVTAVLLTPKTLMNTSQWTVMQPSVRFLPK